MTPRDWHPSDDDLTQYAYRDDTPEDQAAIERHLADCSACSATWREINDLLHLASAADVPEPDAHFEAAVWARLEPHLVAPPIAQARRWSTRQFVVVGAWAAAVGGIAVAGTLLAHRPISPAAPMPTVAASAPSHAQERVLLTALDTHFSQTEMLLVELMNAPDDAAGSLAFERATADDLVQSGRLYRVTAAQAGDRRLTDAIDDVQTVLTEIARGPDTWDKHDLAAIRSRIENDDLLFKVRAVTNDIRGRREKPVASSEGTL